MRKLLIVVMLASLLVVAFAAPALALRDPFDPVISQTEVTGDTGTGTGTDVTADGTNGETGAQVIEQNGSEGLANTGVDTEPWLVAAYALIACGAAAIALSKTLGPQA